MTGAPKCEDSYFSARPTLDTILLLGPLFWVSPGTMGASKDEDIYRRGQSPSEMVFLLGPFLCALIGVAVPLAVVGMLLGLDTEVVGFSLLVGLPGLATVALAARRVVAQRQRESAAGNLARREGSPTPR